MGKLLITPIQIIHIYLETWFMVTGCLSVFLYLKFKLFSSCFILLAIAIRWYFKEEIYDIVAHRRSLCEHRCS